MKELDIVIKTHDTWPKRIDIAISCAYHDSGHSFGKDFVEMKYKYIQYMLDKMLEEKLAICECGDHIAEGTLHTHKDSKTYCELCSEDIVDTESFKEKECDGHYWQSHPADPSIERCGKCGEERSMVSNDY